MARVENAKRWWRLSLTVLFAGILLPIFGITAQVSAAGWGGAVAAQAGQPAAEQDSSSGGDDGGDHGGGDDESGREFKGRVEVMPDGTLYGEWTISGTTYNVTEQTELKQNYGAFEEAIAGSGGTCVVGEMAADGTFVRELQSKRDVVCKHLDDNNDGDGDSQAHGVLYGSLESFPKELKGEWRIQGFDEPIMADDSTEFDQDSGSFAVDALVKIEFVILQDEANTLLAKEIKTIGVAHDDDDHGHGHGDGIDNHAVAFGAIVTWLAEGTEGLWDIGGITYNVTAETELEAQHGELEPGQNVRVKYWIDANGNREAKQIKSMPPAAGGNPQGVLKLIGFVDSVPPEDVGFMGTWVVGDVIFSADENSKFEADNGGEIAKGSLVEVTYRVDGDTRLIIEIETHVVPGGGDDNHIGKVEKMDDSVAVAAAAAATSWRIGGRNFVVTDATMVGNIATGDTVLVNSYTNASGAQVATRISDVTLDNFLFLPAAFR